MSSAHDLETLRKLRAAEIHTLHLTYLRTKRTLIRTASPSRLIRQNVATSLTIATTVGLLISPRTGSPAPPPIHISTETCPPHEIPAPEKPAPKHPLLRTLLTEAAALLLSKIDLQKIITLAIETITHSMTQTQPDNPNEDPHPNVSVADAGTVPANNLDDFQ